MIRLFHKLARDNKGGTAIEYGLILALIVITMMTAFMGVASTTTSMWGNVNTAVEQSRSAG